MKITKLRLQNIRSYSDETIELPDGTVLVRGDNGAGKTTLLMSIFGGLFLSKIRNVGSNDFNLDDIVRRGTEEGEIELTFEVENVPYTVTWTINTAGQNSAEITSPALEEPKSGIRAVRSEVIDVVGMDEDSFSRSVYVQQGEVDRLFDDDARAELIDDLLGLDRIDRYRTRMKGARRAANRLVGENEQAAENHRETIEEEFDYDVEGYESELAKKQAAIAETESELEEINEYLDELRDAKRNLESTIEDHDELKTELGEAQDSRTELLEERGDKQRDIEEAEAEIEAAETEIENLRDRIEEKTNALADLETPATTDSIEIDLATETDAEETLEAARNAVETAKVERQNRENTLEQAKAERDRLREAREQLREERDELEDSLSMLESKVDDAETAVEEIEDELTDTVDDRNGATKEFLPDERCPDSVTDETLEIVESHRDDLTEQKNDCSETLAAKTASLEAEQENVADAREDVEAAESDIDSREERIDEVEAALSSARDDLEADREQFEVDLDALADELTGFDIDVDDDALDTVIDGRIPEAKGGIQESIEETGSRVTELATRKSGLEEDRAELESLDGLATCPKCGQTVDADHLENELDELATEIEELETQLEAAKQERDDHIARRDELDDLRGDAIDLREFRTEAVAATAERVEELEDELETLRDELDEDRDALADAESDLEQAKSEADDLETEIDELDAAIDNLETRIEEGDAVVDAFETVDQLREQHENRVDEFSDLQDESAETEAELETLEAEIDDLSEQLEAQQESVSDAEVDLETADDAIETANEQRELVAEAVDAYDEIDDLEGDIESLQKDIGHARDTIETLNKQLSTVEEEIEDLEEELGETDIEETRAKLESVEDRIEKREATVDDLESKLQSLRSDRDIFENELARLQRFHERLELAAEQREWAQDRADEFEKMMRVYQGAKSDLRAQYLAYVNEYTNDIFSDIYKNSSYQQVRILDEGPDGTPYAIQLLRDDGTLEHPSNASGGERAIVNLALRAGIYKLIAEMCDGDSGRLPPFILDEPTTFLDEGHVGRLEQMLDSITDWDVPQVIVVSHDERLIQGAERECVVSIDEETNASTVDVRTIGRTPGDD
ncbi:AAA family ATPase [Halobacteria archaeon AArc-m2/3/4]|uniref:AAA family ATPase n=1 Tax=Natronoglomus mannanivorans TaxID=2979990 RepID=A0ABT2QLN3_9EURY|nr:AAA family ATPase [Halobacteria archaeon AArc-m2/3/4]